MTDPTTPSNYRIIPLDEVRNNPYYPEFVDIATIFNHDIVASHEDPHSPKRETWRWKKNALACHILEGAAFHTPPAWRGAMHNKVLLGGLDLNELFTCFHRGAFPVEEYMKFYMQIGYSLSGFIEVFGDRTADEFKLPATSEEETLLEYVCRVHTGKVLKL